MREDYEAFKAALEETAVHVPLYVRANGPARSSLGDGIERTWASAATPLGLRLVLLPICAGMGSIVFVEIYADPYARAVLDGWMDSFRFVNGRNIEACEYLDPK